MSSGIGIASDFILFASLYFLIFPITRMYYLCKAGEKFTSYKMGKNPKLLALYPVLLVNAA